MTTYITSEENAFKILPRYILVTRYSPVILYFCSDLFTVSSLLVQKLVTQIRHAFITPDGKNTKPNVGVYSVVQFLKQDVNCYLMLTLTLVCHKVWSPIGCRVDGCTVYTGQRILSGAGRTHFSDPQECSLLHVGLRAELW